MSDTDLSNIDLDTSQIRSWRSIVTLIVFVVTNLIVLFPFHIPFFLPRVIVNAILDALSALRIISPRPGRSHHGCDQPDTIQNGHDKSGAFVRLRFPMNFVTAPLIADLFLLAILAIGRKEVSEGTIGANHISPIDIMAFFITLAYIAISIDASGLIRFLAFKVLQLGGEVGHRLFFYLYAFFFGLGSFIGNDPIILSGTAFLAYMTRVSSNIVHPRAWIYTQFSVANIASAILVSSNPTNLVLAGAFKIRFIDYTANMIVPVVITAIVLFPFLLYIVFADESLIPQSIQMHTLDEEARNRRPVNPNIPNARGLAEEKENEHVTDNEGKQLSLEEIMNPFLDKGGAMFGAVVMAATLITILAINAAFSTQGKELPVFYITCPAAFVMFCWDLVFGWVNRKETREIARKGREEVERARAVRALMQREEAGQATAVEMTELTAQQDPPKANIESGAQAQRTSMVSDDATPVSSTKAEDDVQVATKHEALTGIRSSNQIEEKAQTSSDREMELEKKISREIARQQERGKATLVTLYADAYRWSQETFPTVTAVMTHLPWALIPFAFSMFVLVQALDTKGWVPVFAYGWDHWVEKTGTIGSIGGMGFVSVILCNFAGTNIGTTILLSRVIQAWQAIHIHNGVPITERTFWATVYSMALGVNYGAFSTTFSASLAGLLWRDILARKHIHVKAFDFARVNLPIIAIAMTVGCVILIGEVYIIRGLDPIPLG
ncbi:hypothetical protein F4778DRAFT_765677 [Xylariomycetidae sp. FL2044]|nr:hypothetical protein F4778DRAFT_765677 [Xylariomycetidae sp. FL2044]